MSLIKERFCPECVVDFIKDNSVEELVDELLALHESEVFYPNIEYGPIECTHKRENVFKALTEAKQLTREAYDKLKLQDSFNESDINTDVKH